MSTKDLTEPTLLEISGKCVYQDLYMTRRWNEGILTTLGGRNMIKFGNSLALL